ncbi:LacI family DNA-binding transcriptional regulator [Bifidobacterium catenulatum]|uniref:LacI family DNA-binding transcriptional regulator n=1 Tax=Bifidobacterium catenulatum TaxID=1686 RepID=UPI003D3595D5
MAGIKDVAALAGVSISTVSYVMTGKRPIGANTRRRVLQAARELGYLAKNGGPAPLSGETHFVALSSPVHDSTSYTNYCAYFLNFLKAARQLGYETLLLTEETGDEQLRSIIDTGMVDGVALMDVTMNDPRIELAQLSSIPLISIGHPMNEINVPCIDTDFIEMGEMIMQTLYRNGHSRILFAGGKEIDYERNGGANYLIRLRTSMHDAAARYKIHIDEEFTDEDDFDAAENLLERFISSENTAIVTQGGPLFLNNLVAATRQRGMKIPQDLSLISAGTYTDSIGKRLRIDEFPLMPAELCQLGMSMLVRLMDGTLRGKEKATLIHPVYRQRGSIASR